MLADRLPEMTSCRRAFHCCTKMPVPFGVVMNVMGPVPVNMERQTAVSAWPVLLVPAGSRPLPGTDQIMVSRQLVS